MRKVILCFLFLSMIFCVDGFAQSADKSMASRDIVFALDPWPPNVIKVGNNFIGIDIVIIKELARRMNLNIIYKEMPWPRCLKTMEEGGADILSQAQKRSERQVYMAYIDPPYNLSRLCCYVLKGKGTVINTYEDLAKLKVGTTIKNKYFELFDSDTTINKVDVNEELQVLGMLARGRIDTFVMKEPNADYLIANTGFAGKFEKAGFTHVPEGNKGDSFFTISRKSLFIKDLDKFRATMQQMKDDGTMEKLKSDFFKELEAKKQ